MDMQGYNPFDPKIFRLLQKIRFFFPFGQTQEVGKYYIREQ